MSIKRDDPERRKQFSHVTDVIQTRFPKQSIKYWSCKFWSSKSVTDLMKG